MENSGRNNKSEIQKLREQLQSLEERIAKIETRIESTGTGGKAIRTDSSAPEPEEPLFDSPLANVDGSSIESKVGEYGMAWLGSLVLLFGITFLMTYTNNLGYTLMSSLLGYLAASCVFILGYFLRKSYQHLVFMLNISAYLLIYYASLRLHFFTPTPLISQLSGTLALLLLVIAVQLYFAIKDKSEFLGGIALCELVATAIFSEATHIMLPLLLLSSGIALILFIRYTWWRLLLVSLFLVYFTHLMWLLGNPIMGHELKAVATHQNNLVYLVSYFGFFSCITLTRPHKSISDNVYIPTLIWNGISFAFLLLLVVLTFFKEDYVSLFGFLAALAILFSVLLKFKTANHFDMAFYACFGFLALSISVYGYSKLPDTYLWLALQSLLVVSLALWYRSKIITVVNTLLYLGILIVYLGSHTPDSTISFTFALVALASARIMNWKKERLTLRTDMMRNMYLLAAFVTILYGLYHTVPKEYVTVSWTAAAAVYFLISILLRNFKYRWMAIATLLVTGVYLFLVDLARMEIGYRIVAFLFLALISIGASLYYTKRIRKKK